MVNVNCSLPNRAYVAVLKAKQGELLAVQTTTPESFVPLLEVSAAEKATAVSRAWPHSDHVVWVHPLNVTGIDEEVWANEVERTLTDLHSAETAAVPVVTSNEDAAVLEVVRTAVARDGRGLVIRLDCEDALETGRDGLAAEINDVLGACRVAATDCDVVIDAGLVDGGPAVQASVVSTVLANLPNPDIWRSVVVAFSAFPASVGDIVARESVGSIPRTDAASFAQLLRTWNGRALTYADYGVGVPTYADVPFAPIPNIRYALDDEWRIHRARERRNPSPQYVSLARDLASTDYFAGAAFSPADAYIANVANGSDGPGNAMTYLRVAMSRHFHVVLASLATRGVP